MVVGMGSNAEAIAQLRYQLQQLSGEEYQFIQKRHQVDLPEPLHAQRDEVIRERIVATGEVQDCASMLEPICPSVAIGTELIGELRDLRSRCNALQEVMDQHVMVSIWKVDRQLPEAIGKVELLFGEYRERATKWEEHDVRLNLALSRLSTHEDKVHACMDRIERLPSLNQVRAMWREELDRRLGAVNLEGLGESVHLQAQTLGSLLSERCININYV